MKFSDFQIISVLGSGAFGKVYHVIPKHKVEQKRLGGHSGTDLLNDME
jgi:serine/threonine protein kinase